MNLSILHGELDTGWGAVLVNRTTGLPVPVPVFASYSDAQAFLDYLTERPATTGLVGLETMHREWRARGEAA